MITELKLPSQQLEIMLCALKFYWNSFSFAASVMNLVQVLIQKTTKQI